MTEMDACQIPCMMLTRQWPLRSYSLKDPRIVLVVGAMYLEDAAIMCDDRVDENKTRKKPNYGSPD